MSAGDEKTFPSTLIGGEFADQLVDVTVKVTAVKEQELPDLDDDFAQEASEFDTVEELERTSVTGSPAVRIEQASAARDAVLEKLLTMTDIPLPDSAVADEIKARRDSLNDQLSAAGMTEADYLESEGQSEEGVRGRAQPPGARRHGRAVPARRDRVGRGDRGQRGDRPRTCSAGRSARQYIQHMMEHSHLPEMVAEVRRGGAGEREASTGRHAGVTDACRRWSRIAGCGGTPPLTRTSSRTPEDSESQ